MMHSARPREVVPPPFKVVADVDVPRPRPPLRAGKAGLH